MQMKSLTSDLFPSEYLILVSADMASDMRSPDDLLPFLGLSGQDSSSCFRFASEYVVLMKRWTKTRNFGRRI